MFEVELVHMGFVWTIPIAMCAACLFQFFRCIIDYTGVEYVEFEDDDYYYYVKAVPKASVTIPEKTVKRINERQETGVIEWDK